MSIRPAQRPAESEVGTCEETIASSASRDAFVSEVRRFLGKSLTPDLRAAGRRTIGVHSEIEACRIWHDRLYEQGWIAPAWPRAYGGAAWTLWQRLIFENECADNDAPILFAGGLRNMDPVRMARGAREHNALYIPAVVDW